MSTLRVAVQQYLSLRRGLGFKFRTPDPCGLNPKFSWELVRKRLTNSEICVLIGGTL
jgi:hypothetical protein